MIHDSDNSIQPAYIPDTFDDEFLGESFDGGFNIEYVKALDNKNLDFFINQTMMRIDLPNPIATGQSFSFKIKWWYNINNRLVDRGRSGYETFPNDDNRAYTIAQFFRGCAFMMKLKDGKTISFGVMENLLYHLEIMKLT